MVKFSMNFVLCKDNYDGLLDVHAFDDSDELMLFVSKQICFSDCDDHAEILQIVRAGREVIYGGWKHGMHYTFYDKETNELVYENWFPHWDH